MRVAMRAEVPAFHLSAEAARDPWIFLSMINFSSTGRTRLDAYRNVRRGLFLPLLKPTVCPVLGFFFLQPL